MKKESPSEIMIDLPFSLTVYYFLTNTHVLVKLIILRPFFCFHPVIEVVNLLEVGIIRTTLGFLVCFQYFRAERKLGDFHYIEKKWKALGSFEFFFFFTCYFSLTPVDLFLSIFY